MNNLEFGRIILSSCVAAAMLAGCGGSQPPIGAPGAMPQSRASSGYTTLYGFGKRSSDGQQPKAGLIELNGTLYGTTSGVAAPMYWRLRRRVYDHVVRQGNSTLQVRGW